jgi:hypothetical protein
MVVVVVVVADKIFGSWTPNWHGGYPTFYQCLWENFKFLSLE